MNKLRTPILILFFTALLCNNAGAQLPLKDSSSWEIDELLKKIDTVLQREHIPGLMISIVRKDSILFSGGLGYADIEQKIKVNDKTQFHLASITKFFVAMGIQKLIAEGKLNLHDRLNSIAPEVAFTNKWESTDPVRLVHLLEHTTGFEDIHLNKMVNNPGKSLKGIDGVREVASSLTSRWKPGKMMSYSNPGYNVLGYIIEKESGLPWDKYLEQNIFRPLGMNNSLFDLNGEKLPLYAKGYNFKNGRHFALPLYGPSGNGASSALVSCAEDMGKFMRYLLNADIDSGVNVLGGKDLLEMEKVHSTLAAQRGLQTGYALGNDIFPNNKKITFRGHNGKGEGIVSWIFFNREAGLAYTISANCNTYLWSVSQLIEEFLTKNIRCPTTSSVMIDESKIEPTLGYYQFMNPKNERWDFHKRIFNGINLLAIDGDKLIVGRGNGHTDSLIHMGNGVFRLKGNIIPSLIIGNDNNGNPFFQGYGNSFYSKTSYAPILIQKILIYLGVLAALLTVLYTIVGIPLFLFKKAKIKDLCITYLPFIGIVCFLAAYRTLGLTDEASKELFTTVNVTSFFIFSGMLFFGISVVIAAFILYKRWSHIETKWIKLLLAFNTIFLFYLVILFSIHGWIGVPIWNM